MKHIIKHRNLIIIIATIAFILIAGTYSAFASAPSRSIKASHSVTHKASVASSQAHCNAIGHTLGTGNAVGCVKTKFTPVAWKNNDQVIVVPANWNFNYSCDGGPRFSYYIIDVAGKVAGHPYETLEHNYGVCDNTWHTEPYRMSSATTILIAVSRGGVSINVTA